MYKLNTPTASTLCFSTMGDVLHHLNTAWRYGENPYSQATGSMTLDTAGRTYQIVGNRDLAPSFAQDERSGYDLILNWLDELMPYAKDEVGAIKPPHLMPRHQWLAIDALGKAAYNCWPVFSAKQLYATYEYGGRTFSSLSHFYSTVFFQRFGYGHNGPIYDGENTNSRHEVHVAYALARGVQIAEEILTDYRGAKIGSDLSWLKVLLDKPFLCGRFQSTQHLTAMISMLKATGYELTQENVPAIAGALNALDPKVSCVEVDNTLYRMGLLKLREQPALPSQEELGTPYNEFAANLRVKLGEWKKLTYDKALAERVAGGHTTEREQAYEKAYNASMVDRETHAWANRVAAAIAEKHLPAMLSILDGPENETSKRAVELACGVKLRNVPAAKRRRTLFSLAGFVNDDAYQAEETRLALEQKARQAQREFKQARERAAAFKMRIDDGEPMTGAQYVETLIERGYVAIEPRKRGAASTHYLFNPTTRVGYPVGNPNGTLAYARLMIDKGLQSAGAAKAAGD